MINSLFHIIYLLFSISCQVGYFGSEQTKKAARLCHYYTVLTWRFSYNQYQYFKKRKNHARAPQDTVTIEPLSVTFDLEKAFTIGEGFSGQWNNSISFQFYPRLLFRWTNRSLQMVKKSDTDVPTCSIDIDCTAENVPLNHFTDWLRNINIPEELPNEASATYEHITLGLSPKEQLMLKLRQENSKNNMHCIQKDIAILNIKWQINQYLPKCLNFRFLQLDISFKKSDSRSVENKPLKKSLKKELFALWDQGVHTKFYFDKDVRNASSMIANIIKEYRITHTNYSKNLFNDDQFVHFE